MDSLIIISHSLIGDVGGFHILRENDEANGFGHDDLDSLIIISHSLIGLAMWVGFIS